MVHNRCPRCGYVGDPAGGVRYYECNDCRMIYMGDSYSWRCPKCGIQGNDVSDVRFYECTTCNRLYVGDTSFHKQCPDCGNYGWEV